MPTQFIEGPAGTGKTTYAIQHIRRLLDQGVQPENMLVLVPQRTLGQPYQMAFADSDWPQGGLTDIVTLGGLARRGLETFWPLVSGKAGFADPAQEPRFLTIETAQYYMAEFVNQAHKTGVFDSISITPFSIMRQTLDNLSKAAVNGFSLDEIESRLVAAWGDRHSSRPPVYRASVDLARQFREHCLQNSLLDFSLQIELFMKVLLQSRSTKSIRRHGGCISSPTTWKRALLLWRILSAGCGMISKPRCCCMIPTQAIVFSLAQTLLEWSAYLNCVRTFACGRSGQHTSGDGCIGRRV